MGTPAILIVDVAKGLRAVQSSQFEPVHFGRVLLPDYASSPDLSAIGYRGDIFLVPWTVPPFKPPGRPDIHGIEFERER